MTNEYRHLYETWMRENQRDDLQPLSEGFYPAMIAYTHQLKEQAKTVDKTTVKGKFIEREKDHADKMLADLNKIRLNKIVTAELNGAPIEPLNLTSDEKLLQIELRRLLASFTQSMKQTLQGKEKLESPQAAAPPQVTPRPTPPVHVFETGEHTLKVVRFTQSLPAIMGIDMKTYGPFKAEDVASLPTQNADNLIRKGIAKLVETEP